ncbi:MAG: NAD(P)-dependent alcohol dehydrogenase [Propionibacteriaceae bacterium]|nr:NAD(P)-dependent alcohol dehydrogenase [Propionibacteriaceae bacterium]
MSQSVPQTMRASVLYGANQLELETRPVPKPASDEVLVKVKSVGVCGSDVHFYKEGRLGDWIVEEPLVLGHESGGEIVAVGADVDPARVGERVSIEPQHPSTTSVETLRGEYNLDPQMQFYAVPGTDGAFQEYVTIQSHFAFKISDKVSDDAAGLMEPLSVAIATARKGHFSVGDRVLITGGGPIGLLCAQIARAYGAREVIITDVSAQRRENALNFGATSVIDPIAEDVSKLKLGVDAYVDASGASSAVVSGLYNVRPGGYAVIVGMGDTQVSIPVPVVQNNEIWLTGIFRYNNTWPTAISLVERGIVDLDGLVTNHYGLAQVGEALSSTTSPGVIKSVVNPYR